jgi:hypothetical protein
MITCDFVHATDRATAGRSRRNRRGLHDLPDDADVGGFLVTEEDEASDLVRKMNAELRGGTQFRAVERKVSEL